MAALSLLGMAGASCSLPQAGSGKTPDTGFVFIDGKYVAPPYTVDAPNGDIRINGQVVRPGPKPSDPAGTIVPSPTAPQTADDLVIIGANALRDKKITSYEAITAQVRSDLVSLIKSYPAAAQVSDEGESIVVTDRLGNDARLHLLVKAPTPLDEVRREQAALAAEWSSLLQANGALLLSPGAAFQVTPTQVGSFLAALFEAFAQPEAARGAILDDLIKAPSITSAILAAGPPPADLRRRIPKVAPTQPPPGTSPRGSAAGSVWTSIGPVDDPRSHKDSHTPKSLAVVLMHTLNNTGESASVAEAARMQGYNVAIFTGGYGLGPGDVTIDRFLATSGDIGILYIDAHGDRNTVSVEQYRFKGDRDKALLNYRARGIPVTAGEVWSIPYLTYNYTVDINRQTIARWKGTQTIVELSSCDGFGLADAFLNSGAREFVGPIDSVDSPTAKAFNNKLWPRMAGTQDQGVDRNMVDAYNASVAGTIFRWKGDGKTVLSPAVAKYSPQDGATVAIGVEVKATVTFDTPMDTHYLPVWDLSGTCKPFFFFGPSSYPGRIGWVNDRTFVFSFIPRQPGGIDVDVGGGIGIARGGENDTYLDGNQYPAKTDHVGPNGDPFVWHLNCAGTPPKATPTPSSKPVSSPPSCSGQAKLIVDQFYPDAVQGGNGAIPTFSTGGKKHCLTHLATYHWNDGKGAPAGGTLKILDAAGKVIDGGPWNATATPGTGGALVNWEADISTTPPVILDGTYTVQDSDPATWSWSKASGGKGFIRVWGIEYV